MARQARHWQTKAAKVNVWAVVVPDNVGLLLWSSTFTSSLQSESQQSKGTAAHRISQPRLLRNLVPPTKWAGWVRGLEHRRQRSNFLEKHLFTFAPGTSMARASTLAGSNIEGGQQDDDMSTMERGHCVSLCLSARLPTWLISLQALEQKPQFWLSSRQEGLDLKTQKFPAENPPPAPGYVPCRMYLLSRVVQVCYA